MLKRSAVSCWLSAASRVGGIPQGSCDVVEFNALFSAILRMVPELLAPMYMAYVITDSCTKDELCVQACPVDCIHPKQDEGGFADVPHLYVNPNDCIDCGACVPVCPTNSIYTTEDLPADLAKFAEINAVHYN